MKMKRGFRFLSLLIIVVFFQNYLSIATSQQDIVKPCISPIITPSPVTNVDKISAPSHHIFGNEQVLNETLDVICKQYSVQGCSIAAFAGKEIVYTHSYGNARPEQPADENTKYRIASISKAVTATLAMKLEEDGKLSLDYDIAQIHPKLQNPFYPDETTTLKMLMTHTSGIIDGSGYNSAIHRSVFPSLDVVLQKNNFSGHRPGERYVYSNFGMGLVCAAIEQVTQQHFFKYAQDVLFEPLGIDAGFLINQIEDKNSIAALGSVDPLSWGNMAAAYQKIPLGQMYLLGQGELYISARDLAQIAIILAGDGSCIPAGSSQTFSFLNPETLEKMHTPLVYDPETNTTRGLALQMTEDIIDGVTFWGHQGNAYGVISCMFYDRESQKGIVFLTNNANQMRAENKIYAVNDAVVKAIWQYLE